jgi:glycosyltransferase involved in cell wall biosynthesis
MAATGDVYTHDSHERFADSGRVHILMITNHGVHEWKVIPGMPDTGGQNVYVNQFTEALVAQGYRVTIANRGGYPHPKTGRMQSGVCYHPSGHARILYLEDGTPTFIRKEDMNEQLPELADDLAAKLRQDGDTFDLIISHYWDAGKLGVMLNESSGTRRPHLWIPHSLGALKKRNMDPSTWDALRIDERIAHEHELLKSIDGGVATSTAIRDTFLNDYGYEARYFLPPCVDEVRYRPRTADETEPIWAFLSEQSGLDIAQLKRRKLVTEISRTDKTKRKDVLIKAFASVRKEVPEALLLVSIDPHAGALHDSLRQLIDELGLRDDVIVLGSVWEQLPLLYNATDVYCTPSVMEGFGMSAQEAAATAKPVVSSDLVPFVCEYLVGADPERIAVDHQGPTMELLSGEAGIVVPADFVEGFAAAVVRLLADEDRMRTMGLRAREITVPYFTWRHLTEALLADVGISTDGEVQRA